uniref:RHS repeat-associated core domain-containing protein n=1 Tax=Paractinoplanes polyasparticus TaxID=2856853 RepID=UPI001C8538AB|nr:RHS repeat-associated core domain-containing protein [Actinoplanes polyasparticus]
MAVETSRLSIEYGAGGLPVSHTDGAGSRIEFAYNADLRLTAVTDPDGRVWRYTYDPAGRLAGETDFDGRTQNYRRDADGRLTAHVNAAGGTTHYRYDGSGRLVERRAGAAVTRRQYDPAGRVVEVTNSDAVVRLEYDAQGRVVAETVNGRTVRTTYDGEHVAFQTLPSGQEIGWSPDPLGLDVDVPEIDRSYALDQAGRIRAVSIGGLVIERYDYDRAGNLVGEGGIRWLFDGTMLMSTTTARFTYDALGRLCSRTDPAGNWRFSWDDEDQLSQATTPTGDRWRYRYDGYGRRIAKQRLGADDTVLHETTFTWAGDLLVEEEGPDGTVAWAYRSGVPISQTGPAGRHTVVTDPAGTPTHLIDADGATYWQTTGTLFGRHPVLAATPLRFPGQYHDIETGLHYNRFRYFDPATARYLSPDPLGLAGGPTPTAYPANPLTTIDRLGLAGCTVPQPSLNPFDGRPSTMPDRAVPPTAEAITRALRPATVSGSDRGQSDPTGPEPILSKPVLRSQRS